MEPLELSEPEGMACFGRWTVRWSTASAPVERLDRVGWETWLSAFGGYRLRTWLPGDRIRPVGGTGSRLVVRCMQDLRLARGDRPQWPVLEADGAVIWVPGVCRSDSRVPEPGSLAMRIDVGPG
jgi:tRNA(Ile)-lysidine synthetase-like protein